MRNNDGLQEYNRGRHDGKRAALGYDMEKKRETMYHFNYSPAYAKGYTRGFSEGIRFLFGK